MDAFLFLILLTVSACTLFDWFIGEKGRGNIRERVGNAWLHLEEYGLKELIFEDIGRVLTFARTTFGERIFSRRRFLFVALFGVPSSILILLLLNGDFGFRKPFQSVFMATVSGYFGLFLSLTITIWILTFSIWANRVTIYLAFSILDAAFSVFFAILVFILALGLVETTYSLGWAERSSTYSRVDIPDFHALNISVTGAILALFPPFLHFGYVAFTVFLKFTRRLLEPISSVVLLRLHESKKGVLTQVSVALGVSAKILQEGIDLLF